MDLFGATALILFAVHLAFNQVVIKVTSDGFSPVFQAGVRSAGAIAVLLIWMRWRGISLVVPRRAWAAGLLSGTLFAFEFMCLFSALDVTTVGRASIIFYSMPVWLALVGHVFLPGERLSGLRALGFALAMAGVVVALADRSGGAASWAGDLLALASAFSWVGIVLCVRLTPLVEVPAAQQLICQVLVSAPLLLLIAPLFGPLLREPDLLHVSGLLFQIVAVASLGFLSWFWLMSIYPAASVASFSFLSPVASVFLGWLLLGEALGPGVYFALLLVACGLFLINRKA